MVHICAILKLSIFLYTNIKEGDYMNNFEPLWETMKAKGITQYQLIEEHGIDRRLLSALRQNKNITTASLERLCRILDCTPNEIVNFIK